MITATCSVSAGSAASCPCAARDRPLQIRVHHARAVNASSLASLSQFKPADTRAVRGCCQNKLANRSVQTSAAATSQKEAAPAKDSPRKAQPLSRAKRLACTECPMQKCMQVMLICNSCWFATACNLGLFVKIMFANCCNICRRSRDDGKWKTSSRASIVQQVVTQLLSSSVSDVLYKEARSQSQITINSSMQN